MLIDHVNKFLMEELNVFKTGAMRTSGKRTLDGGLTPRFRGELYGGSMGLVVMEKAAGRVRQCGDLCKVSSLATLVYERSPSLLPQQVNITLNVRT